MGVRSQNPWRPPEDRQLGRYRLLAEIARGGIGAVHVGCLDGKTGFRKLVAIKTVRPDLADEPALVRMLLDEARLASRLHHPNIAQLYDLGDDDGAPYLVMEYVHGESLSAVASAAGPLAPRIGAWMAAQICDALAYAHLLRDERDHPLGLVHRDVSPQNILIGYEGVPRLVDFGIARARHRTVETEAGVVKGRFAYMAPEQRAGKPVDGRADLHALGVVLYQITVGAHPYELAGADSDTDRIPDPRSRQPDYPAPLWHLIEKATAADSALRFATATDMLAALRDVAGELGQPVDRAEVAALLDGPFAARRAAKQKLLDGAPVDGDTEILAPVAPTPTETAMAAAPAATDRSVTLPVRARARTRRRLLAGAAVIATAGVAAVAVDRLAVRQLADRAEPAAAPEQPEVPAPAIAGRLCLLVDTGGSLPAQEASWVAVRLVGRALDRHPTLVPVHGYRTQDSAGWNPAGRERALAACRGVGAATTVVIGGAADGAMRAQVDERTLDVAAGDPLRRAIELAGALAAARGAAADWGAILPAWPVDLLHPLLEIQDAVALQEPPNAGRKLTFDTVTRKHPALEYAYLASAITRWWGGELDDPAARATMPRPQAPSARTADLLSAVAALASGAVAEADALAAPILEDQRWAGDALTVYLAGEARVHAGRPAEGAQLLERALELDPQLTPAIYHVFERRLAEGDQAGVDKMAALWERVDPASPRPLEMRAQAALGAGRYAEAGEMFASLLDRSRSDAAALHRPNAGLIHARLLAGDIDGAVAHARLTAANLGTVPAITAVLPEPIIYAFALGRADAVTATEWEKRVRERMANNQSTPNYWQLAYSMAIIDRLAGRDRPRARWIGAGPPPAVPKRYRFEPYARMFTVLDAAAAGDRAGLTRAAAAGDDLPAQHMASALLAERQGQLEVAADHFESASGSSAGGEMRCVALAGLVRVHRAAGRADAAAAVCQRIRAPRVPSAFCLVARRDCPGP